MVCSVFYSISALHLASYDENTVEQKIAEINAELENDIANVISSQNENYELRLAPYEEAKIMPLPLWHNLILTVFLIGRQT